MMSQREKMQLRAATRDALVKRGLARLDVPDMANGYRVTAHRIADEHAEHVQQIETEAMLALVRKHAHSRGLALRS